MFRGDRGRRGGNAVTTEGTGSRRRRMEYTKDGPTGQERSPAKSSSPFIHAPQFLSFVRSFVPSTLVLLVTLLPLLPPFCGCLLRHFSARGICRTQVWVYEQIMQRTPNISDCHSRDLDRLDCFFDCELISRAKLLLRSHKRAWPRIEWLVMGVNYVQLYCVCARRIY